MKNRRILVVDNEPQRRSSLRRLLRENDKGIETLEADTCEEALELLASEEVDLVLTETELPSKSGHYLLRQVRDQHPEIGVILITHNASSYNLLQALRNGAYDFIVRPIDTGEILFSAVERALHHCDQHRHNADRLNELMIQNQSLQKSLKMMLALTTAIERMTSAADIEDLFLDLLDAAMNELQASCGFIALFDRASGKLGLKVSRGISPELCRQYSAGMPAGLILALARRGKPVAIPGSLPEKLAVLAKPDEAGNLLADPGLLSVPLQIKERVAGIVVISGHPEDRNFGDQELDFLIRLCRHAVMALEKIGIIHQLKRGRMPAEAPPAPKHFATFSAGQEEGA